MRRKRIPQDIQTGPAWINIDATLTSDEQVSWERCLGVQHDDISLWGRVVARHLAAQPVSRRVAHLAHALRYYPFFPHTPDDAFAVCAIPNDEWRRRTESLHRKGIHQCIQQLRRPGVFPLELAAELDKFLRPLDADDCAVCLAVIFSNGVAPTGLDMLPRAQGREIEAGWRMLVEEREAMLAMYPAMWHFTCDHSSMEAAAAMILRALDRVRDPTHRAYVLSQAIFGIATQERQDAERERTALIEAAGRIGVREQLMREAQTDDDADESADEGA